ncbi:hypothetical protein TIFTF001_006573 [Ficus carica]|uniref:Uncharacterized protein n=1 Tax=Ficus carica TaxID=3494 RepID=A0AA88CYV0_FICCA|nr:hypothetical protein TIFTF001_006573 [Ficus carica]
MKVKLSRLFETKKVRDGIGRGEELGRQREQSRSRFHTLFQANLRNLVGEE